MLASAEAEAAMAGGRCGRAALSILGLVAAADLAACAGAPSLGPPGSLAGGPWGSVHADGGLAPRAYNRPYVVHGRRYDPADQPGYAEVGVASWYGLESGRRTSDGEVFTLDGFSAAHRTLPIPSLLEVTNLDNGRRVVVRLNDRGPFAPGRLVDLSRGAADRLGFVGPGVARVRVRYLGPAAAAPPVRFARTEMVRGYAARRTSPPSADLSSVAEAGAPPLDPAALVADLPD